MNWEDRSDQGPTPGQYEDQITILRAQLDAATRENVRLRSLGETDIKVMIETACTKLELAVVTIRQALSSAGIKEQPRDERRSTARKSQKRGAVPEHPAHGLPEGEPPRGDDTGEVREVPDTPDFPGLRTR